MSKISGAMFLHRAIPHISDNNQPDMLIDIIKVGTREGYAENVYGDPQHPVSWDKFSDGQIPAWDLRQAYGRLWEQNEALMYDTEIDPDVAQEIEKQFDYTFSSIPATALCTAGHYFRSKSIWLHKRLGGLIEKVNDGNMMYYNGYTTDGKYGFIGPDWYRYSQIKEHRAWEFASPPSDDEWPFERAVGYKPLSTNCDCLPRIRRIGRFGKWEKQVLSHHAYEEVLYALL